MQITHTDPMDVLRASEGLRFEQMALDALRLWAVWTHAREHKLPGARDRLAVLERLIKQRAEIEGAQT